MEYEQGLVMREADGTERTAELVWEGRRTPAPRETE